MKNITSNCYHIPVVDRRPSITNKQLYPINLLVVHTKFCYQKYNLLLASCSPMRDGGRDIYIPTDGRHSAGVMVKATWNNLLIEGILLLFLPAGQIPPQ